MYTACGRCAACVSGDHRRCNNMQMFGMGRAFGNLQGGQAEYIRVPLADMTLRPIPANLDDESTIFTGGILSPRPSRLCAPRIRQRATASRSSAPARSVT